MNDWHHSIDLLFCESAQTKLTVAESSEWSAMIFSNKTQIT